MRGGRRYGGPHAGSLGHLALRHHSPAPRGVPWPRRRHGGAPAACLCRAQAAGRLAHAAGAAGSHARHHRAGARGLPAPGGQRQHRLAGRAHFFGVASRAMRRILVDHARRRTAQKRSRQQGVSLDEGVGAVELPGDEVLIIGMDTS